MRFKNKKGITLIEVSISLVIMLILVTLTVPSAVNMSQSSEAMGFQANLADIENAIKIMTESNDYLGQYPIIDSHFYYIELNGSGNNNNKAGGPSVISKYQTGEKVSNNLIGREVALLPTSLEVDLEKKFGRHAKLTAYVINMQELHEKSSIVVSPLYPKDEIEGISANMFQNESAINVNTSSMFAGSVNNIGSPYIGQNLTSNQKRAIDEDDLIPNDLTISQPGYYFMIDTGDTISVFYSGTDAIAYDKYIHTP